MLPQDILSGMRNLATLPGQSCAGLRPILQLLVLFVLLGLSADKADAADLQTDASPAAPVLKIEGLGKGAAPIDGAWQFRLGDNPAWAAPDLDDTTGHDGWEQIKADSTWGTQTHPNYDGYGWYRRRIEVTPAAGVSPNFALLIPAIDEVYELYWNGRAIGRLGNFPPQINYLSAVPPQTYGMGPVQSGVLAVRVFKVPLASNDDGTAGGFESAPLIGSPSAIAAAKDSLDYRWLRSQQFQFALAGLYALVSFLSLFAWLRNKSQRLLFWMMVYTLMPPLATVLTGLRLQASGIWLTFLTQTAIQLREVAQWYVLIYLLDLEDRPQMMRAIRVLAIASIVCGLVDGSLGFVYVALGHQTFQIVDAVLTFLILPGEAIPIFLVVYAIFLKKRLDSARWIVAIIALANDVLYAVSNISQQGIRYTHWPVSGWLNAPHLTVMGSVLALQALLRTALFLAIVYAVLRYAMDYRQRQTALEREFQNAREVQQVLVPEAFPSIPGFAIHSAYRPAREVGGDFFQILPTDDGGALIVIGDVSGKGMPAAMTVSLLVGTVRTLAHYTHSPSEILTAMNFRMLHRSAGGFTTCLVVRVDAEGRLTAANAGHLAPYLNGQELAVENGLPLGL